MVSVVSTISIVYISELKFDGSYRGFNQFIEYFRFPIAVLATSIPLGAIYATNHRSEQTKKQIVTTNVQNNFINYYKHIEEFEKYASNHFENHGTHLISARETYNKLFTNSKNGDYTLSNTIVNEIEQRTEEIVTCLIEINKENIESIHCPEELFKEIEQKAEKALELLGISYVCDWGSIEVQTNPADPYESDSYTSSQLWLIELNNHFKIIFHLFSFNLPKELPPT